jgi:hypothetical protein
MNKILYLSVCLFALGCKQEADHRVTIHLRGAFNRQYVVSQPGINEERELILDSARARSNNDSIVVDLPSAEPRPYRLSIPERGIDIFFVNDTKNVVVFCNNQARSWRFENSPASVQWQDFQKGQASLVVQQRKLNRYMDSLSALRPDAPGTDSAKKAIYLLVQQQYDRNYHFADTTTNPGLFLMAYGLVEFGSDYKGLDSFITRVGQRFPRHRIIQELVTDARSYARTFGNPFHIGDTVQDLVLPDKNGAEFSLYSIKNRYILINFWSTLCFQCKPFMDSEKQWMLSSDQLELVSVALDNQQAQWQNIIHSGGYDWIQLIDDKMWNGPTAKTFRFDSIPFNFLIGPDRRILAKGIQADSLQETLSRFIKH